MRSHYVIAQIIGFVALLCYLLSYQVRSNRGLYLAQTAGNFLFMVQFLLLGAYSGCANLVVGILRNLLLTQYGKHKWIRCKGWIAVFGAAHLAVLLFTWNGWTSLLPFAAMMTCTVAFWTDNALNIRKANLFVACPAWIVYDILFGAWAGLLNEMITIASILISIWRFGWNNLGDPESGFSQKTEEDN